MKPFPKIEQFHTAIKNVQKHHDRTFLEWRAGDDEYPVLEFTGTVKLHGTNAAVVKHADGQITYQSHFRCLSLDKDNYKFMHTMEAKGPEVNEKLFQEQQFTEYCAVYGEWCGGNIQNGVAIENCRR